MPTVFLREGNPTFHKSKECTQLVKRPARGQPHPVIESDLVLLERVRPCKTCYPDAPRIKVARRYCSLCNKKYVKPCPHNGGVPVTIGVKTTYVSLFRSPGDEFFKTVYVWPDNVWLYEIAS